MNDDERIRSIAQRAQVADAERNQTLREAATHAASVKPTVKVGIVLVAHQKDSGWVERFESHLAVLAQYAGAIYESVYLTTAEALLAVVGKYDRVVLGVLITPNILPCEAVILKAVEPGVNRREVLIGPILAKQCSLERTARLKDFFPLPFFDAWASGDKDTFCHKVAKVMEKAVLELQKGE